MTRRDALKGMAAGTGGLITSGCVMKRSKRTSTKPERPNVLVVFGDQWRGQDVGCLGNTDVMTPHVDGLAREGILYLNAIANYPLCTPSRAQLLTGRYPHALELVTNDLAIRTNEVSIAHVLGAHGYRCGYIGKWHLDGWPRDKFTPPGPRRLGFDDYWAVWNCSHEYFNAKYYLDTPEPVSIQGYEPNHQTGLAIKFIENHCEEYKNRPFCLFVSYAPPHEPYELVPERYSAMYDPDRIRLRPNCKEPTRRDIADYYAACTALDENMGRMLDTLDRCGIAENTIVVFTSDHGDMLWSQGNTKKQQPWGESILIPLIIRYPARIKPGQRSGTLICVSDIMPTILGIVGVSIPPCVQGTELSWSALGGRGQESPSAYLMEMFGIGQVMANRIFTWRGVRTRRYLYAEDLSGPWLLYDLERDAYEMRNVVGSNDYKSAQDELAAELRSWYKRLDETYLPAVEQARAVGRCDEAMALMNAVIPLYRPDHPEVIMLKQYLADGGNWTNRRF